MVSYARPSVMLGIRAHRRFVEQARARRENEVKERSSDLTLREHKNTTKYGQNPNIHEAREASSSAYVRFIILTHASIH